MSFTIGLLIGLFVGAAVGLFTMALCNAAKENDRLIRDPETVHYPDDEPDKAVGSSGAV